MKKVFAGLLSALIALSLVACGENQSPNISSVPEEPSLSFDEYKDKASDFTSSVLDASVILSNVGKYEYNFWDSLSSVNGDIDYDDMVDRAMKWLSEKSESDSASVSATYDELGVIYSDLVICSYDDGGADEIAENINDLFSAYNQLYLLVTEPSGDIGRFADRFNKYSDVIVEKNSMLEVLLGKRVS